MNKPAAVGIVIVAYGHEAAIGQLLDTLGRQKKTGDRIIVVDNHPDHASAAIAEAHEAVDRVVKAENNGFSAGCNLGAAQIIDDVELLYFLNPDTFPDTDAVAQMRLGADSSYDAWMSLLTLPSGLVNSAGTTVHISGLSWCDGLGDVSGAYTKDTRIYGLSGACMMVRSSVWRAIGGLCEDYFLYYEDTDLSARLVLAGYRLGLLPGSRVGHDYEFEKGDTKWLYLERNRPLFIIRTWPTAVIVVLAPQLIAVELGLVVISVVQKRFRLKVKSTVMTLKAVGAALRARREIQASRRISAYKFLITLQPRLNTPVFGQLSKSKFINRVLVQYYRLALRLLSLRRQA